MYPEELSSLLGKDSHVRRSNQLSKLDPFLHDGIFKVGGRLNKSAMPEEARCPTVLHKEHHIARLILQQVHRQNGHCGRNQLIAKVRQQYWIPGLNRAARTVISKCFTCRKIHAKPSVQKMADLLEERVLPDKRPFTHVGVDYFGPFGVKRGRSMVKRYGVLFTCFALRAVHIEVAHSLDTSSCINAIRRFICRRGQVSTLHSDNGTNFIGAEKELREAIAELDHSKIREELMPKGIAWTFNTPTASHQGGIWERQIRTVRKVLNSVLRQQTLDDDGLHTLLCEVEAIINDRPLTATSVDPHDLEVLTPNRLLLLKKQPILPPGLFDSNDTYSRRRWRQTQYMANLFWSRWTKEYLPLLQEQQKWRAQRRNFVAGDLVLIVDSSAPRNAWLTGRIQKTFPDSRGIVRRVQVQTKSSLLDRPINKLCLLFITGSRMS